MGSAYVLCQLFPSASSAPVTGWLLEVLTVTPLTLAPLTAVTVSARSTAALSLTGWSNVSMIGMPTP